MNIWFTHAGGKVNQPFCLLKLGGNIYLLLRGGGAVSKSLAWLDKERKCFRRI